MDCIDNETTFKESSTNNSEIDSFNNRTNNYMSTTSKQPLLVELCYATFAYPSGPDKIILGPAFLLKIHPGELMAIVWWSGSGKSTIAALLTRLYDCTSSDTSTSTKLRRNLKYKHNTESWVRTSTANSWPHRPTPQPRPWRLRRHSNHSVWRPIPGLNSLRVRVVRNRYQHAAFHHPVQQHMQEQITMQGYHRQQQQLQQQQRTINLQRLYLIL